MQFELGNDVEKNKAIFFLTLTDKMQENGYRCNKIQGINEKQWKMICYVDLKNIESIWVVLILKWVPYQQLMFPIYLSLRLHCTSSEEWENVCRKINSRFSFKF